MIVNENAILYYYWYLYLLDKPIQTRFNHYLQITQQQSSLYKEVISENPNQLDLSFFLNKCTHIFLSQLRLFSQKVEGTIYWQAIKDQLKKIIGPDFLRKLAKRTNVGQICQKINQNCNFHEFAHFLNLANDLYKSIYSSQQNVQEQLNNFQHELLRQFSQNKFSNKELEIKYTYTLLNINYQTLHRRKEYKKIVQLYHRYIKHYLEQTESGQIFASTKQFASAFYAYIEFTMLHDAENWQHSIQYYYEIIIKYKNFGPIFEVKQGSINIFYLSAHLLKNNLMTSFLDFHLSLSEYLGNYSYKNNIECYLKYFSLKNGIQRENVLQIMQIMRTSRLYLSQDNAYITILYSNMLCFIGNIQEMTKMERVLTKKILKYISERAFKTKLQVRRYVLSQVYSFLNQNKKRCIFVSKNYFKYLNSKISINKFFKAMNFKRAKSFTQQKKRYFSLIDDKLLKWYNNLAQLA